MRERASIFFSFYVLITPITYHFQRKKNKGFIKIILDKKEKQINMIAQGIRLLQEKHKVLKKMSKKNINLTF